MKYLIVKQLSIDNHFLWDIWKLINIDRRKLVEFFVLILKEVIDRFIWTIEHCHI
jgi:hypothetical protein